MSQRFQFFFFFWATRCSELSESSWTSKWSFCYLTENSYSQVSYSRVEKGKIATVSNLYRTNEISVSVFRILPKLSFHGVFQKRLQTGSVHCKAWCILPNWRLWQTSTDPSKLSRARTQLSKAIEAKIAPAVHLLSSLSSEQHLCLSLSLAHVSVFAPPTSIFCLNVDYVLQQLKSGNTSSFCSLCRGMAAPTWRHGACVGPVMP